MLGLSINDLLTLGRNHSNDSAESFNMAYLAVHGSGAMKNVSHHKNVAVPLEVDHSTMGFRL